MKRLLLFPFLSLCLVHLPVNAQETAPVSAASGSAGEAAADPAEAYRSSAASIDQDLRAALDELAALRATIAAEKPDIAAEAERIAADLREKRRQSEIARTKKDAIETEFEKAGNDLKVWRDERAYIESLLLDFSKTRATTSGPLSPSSDPAAPLATVADVLDELSRTGGPVTLPGEAIAEDGILTPGTFVTVGPVSWFLADSGGAAGLVVDGEDLKAHLVSKGTSRGEIEKLVKGEADTISFDPTLGSAIALSESESTIIEHTKAGGFWIYPILLLAAASLIATVCKWVQIARIREFGAHTVQRILDALARREPEAARSEAAVIRHPARALLEKGISFVDSNPEASREELEEALYEKYLEATPGLQRGLAVIAIAAAAAPLLGLLGTVTGMIETFRLINVFGTGDAKSLASGISEALITTEYGLIVAIPSLILHALLSRKVQGIKSTMEMTSLAFLNGTKTK
ncbi:MAG: MotA/TolQ/ExbB proton channel family protein [Verrucomicrobiaceae bacterium]|nr:MotA/TolQ/ExbB proton channel family protein [Verrucomicrobiaceae bacterium]